LTVQPPPSAYEISGLGDGGEIHLIVDHLPPRAAYRTQGVFPAMSGRASDTKRSRPDRAQDGAMESGQEWILGERNRRAGAEIPGSRSMLTLQEIAETFRVTRSTIHRLLKSNQIPAFRIGRHWRFQRGRDQQLVFFAHIKQGPKPHD
jgi:excisionase family DNA binding protein